MKYTKRGGRSDGGGERTEQVVLSRTRIGLIEVLEYYIL